jgi:hypothetical protein
MTDGVHILFYCDILLQTLRDVFYKKTIYINLQISNIYILTFSHSIRQS